MADNVNDSGPVPLEPLRVVNHAFSTVMNFTPPSRLSLKKLRPRIFLAAPSRLAVFLLLGALTLATSVPLNAVDTDVLHAGFLFDEFNLTLAPGHRTEALGPFFYDQEKETQRVWAVPPLLSYARDPGTESKEFDFLYPVLTYDRYGDQYRWQLFQILSFAGGPTQRETARDRFNLFPLYFQQRSSDTNENYTALFPIYGHLKHRFFRDEIFFVMFPLYSQTRKKDVVTDNYLWPIVSLRHGDSLSGWKFWPLAGNEHKGITTQTNGWGDVITNGGHESFFALWPLYFNDRSGIGTTNEQRTHASIPAYSVMRSPLRDSTTVIWPFFNYVDDREKKYHEWDTPWPLVVFARGEGKHTSRVWPFYSHATNATLESDFWLWPVYKYNRVHSAPLDRRRTRICFFLYSDLAEKNTETEAVRRRVDFWPFFVHHRDFNGNSRVQVLALLESFMPENKSIERNCSPLWSVWRSEKNPRAGASSQSLLWNLYRHDATPDSKKCSLLFGLFQYQSSAEGKKMRLFYVPLTRGKSPPEDGAIARAGRLTSMHAQAGRQ